jgi:hypothetical protein
VVSGAVTHLGLAVYVTSDGCRWAISSEGLGRRSHEWEMRADILEGFRQSGVLTCGLVGMAEFVKDFSNLFVSHPAVVVLGKVRGVEVVGILKS